MALKRSFLASWEVGEGTLWCLNQGLPSFLEFRASYHRVWPTCLAYPAIDNLVEGKRKRRSNVSSPATPTASSSSSTTPTRKITESPRASMGVLSGKRKLITSEEERSPAKRGRKSATVKPGKCSFLPHSSFRPWQNAGSAAGKMELNMWQWPFCPAIKSGSCLRPQVIFRDSSLYPSSPIPYRL